MWKFFIFCAFTVIWTFTASELNPKDEYDFEQLGNSDDAGDSPVFLELEKSHRGCNVTLNKTKSGTFYPNEATKSTGFYCYWNILAPINSTDHLCLFFNNLILDSNDEANIYQTVEDAEAETSPIIPNPIKAQNGSITVITRGDAVVVTLKGNNRHFIRDFEVYYSYECSSPVPPTVKFLHSPVYTNNVEASPERECIFRFNVHPNSLFVPVFTFLEYDMDLSNVIIEDSIPEIGRYNKNQPLDFFVKDHAMNLKVTPKINSTDHFLLKIHHVDKRCSFYKNIASPAAVTLTSPPEMLDNSTNVVECRWLIQHAESSKILGLQLDTLEFQSVFDIVAVNDGLSEISTPMLQITTSNRNYSRNQLIRSGGPYIWISFKPLTYESRFIANVTVHGQGGHFKNSGVFGMHFTTGDDTAFLLEVEDGKVVQLTFDTFAISPPATVSIYDGFDRNHLLTMLQKPAKFPILSPSSQMMVVGTNFSATTNKFSAKFEGVSPGCNHMNSPSTENYILSENCNSSCSWIIPPEDGSDSELIIYLQYISLKKGDQIKIRLLDESSTVLGNITAETKHVPQLAVPINVGAIINVNQAACKSNKTDKIILIAHSSLIPDCKHSIMLKSSEKLQISSPLYPDTYPVFSTCQWNLTLPKESFVHMAFQTLELAENHCLRIYENQTLKYEFAGKVLPDDIFLNENAVVQFDSSQCDKKQVTQPLKSDSGFLLNVTVADCGAILDGTKNGEFNTSISGDKSTCIWKVDVTAKDSVNILSYTVTKKDELKNYELTVYDGSSVRDSEVMNNTNSDIWSRSSVMIFIYRRLNISQPSSLLVIKYNIITCNSSMLCENQLCMHPDWRCNGHNDCGDFSDEKNCGSAPPSPLPPEVKFTGYSATAFWLSFFAMLIIGTIIGLLIPVCYQKYRDSRYSQFRELNGIDG